MEFFFLKIESMQLHCEVLILKIQLFFRHKSILLACKHIHIHMHYHICLLPAEPSIRQLLDTLEQELKEVVNHIVRDRNLKIKLAW